MTERASQGQVWVDRHPDDSDCLARAALADGQAVDGDLPRITERIVTRLATPKNNGDAEPDHFREGAVRGPGRGWRTVSYSSQ